nr:MAG TPA: Protein of unknown function (DUF2678) [Caudoviricetes sp.]
MEEFVQPTRRWYRQGAIPRETQENCTPAE